jgi:hypothetical protein
MARCLRSYPSRILDRLLTDWRSDPVSRIYRKLGVGAVSASAKVSRFLGPKLLIGLAA